MSSVAAHDRPVPVPDAPSRAIAALRAAIASLPQPRAAYAQITVVDARSRALAAARSEEP